MEKRISKKDLSAGLEHPSAGIRSGFVYEAVKEHFYYENPSFNLVQICGCDCDEYTKALKRLFAEADDAAISFVLAKNQVSRQFSCLILWTYAFLNKRMKRADYDEMLNKAGLSSLQAGYILNLLLEMVKDGKSFEEYISIAHQRLNWLKKFQKPEPIIKLIKKWGMKNRKAGLLYFMRDISLKSDFVPRDVLPIMANIGMKLDFQVVWGMIDEVIKHMLKNQTDYFELKNALLPLLKNANLPLRYKMDYLYFLASLARDSDQAADVMDHVEVLIEKNQAFSDKGIWNKIKGISMCLSDILSGESRIGVIYFIIRLFNRVNQRDNNSVFMCVDDSFREMPEHLRRIMMQAMILTTDAKLGEMSYWLGVLVIRLQYYIADMTDEIQDILDKAFVAILKAMAKSDAEDLPIKQLLQHLQGPLYKYDERALDKLLKYHKILEDKHHNEKDMIYLVDFLMDNDIEFDVSSEKLGAYCNEGRRLRRILKGIASK